MLRCIAGLGSIPELVLVKKKEKKSELIIQPSHALKMLVSNHTYNVRFVQGGLV